MKFYLSIPMSKSLLSLKDHIEEIRNLGNSASYWNKHTLYDSKILKDSDALILHTSNNEFEIHSDDLTLGCKKEVLHCLQNEKPIFLAYTPANGKIKVYETVIETILYANVFKIKGVRGTGNFCLNETISKQIDQVGLEQSLTTGIDKRVFILVKNKKKQ